MYHAHGSWIALVIFGGLFGLRLLSAQRRRGGYRRTPTSKSSFTNSDPRGPSARPTAEPPNQSGSTHTAPTVHTGTAPGWFRDPFFKHEHRYWSGSEWTEHVTDGGVPGVEPPP
jgi:hypothetical protein